MDQNIHRKEVVVAGWELIPGATRGERESAGQVNCFRYVGPPMNKPLPAPASSWWPSCSGSVTEYIHYRLELSAKDGRECRGGSRSDLLATAVCSWNRRGAQLWMLFVPGPQGGSVYATDRCTRPEGALAFSLVDSQGWAGPKVRRS